jgi:hypothetical protein
MDYTFEVSIFIIKLLAFLIAGCLFTSLLYHRTVDKNLKKIYPFISILFLPLFFGFKALQFLGKGSFHDLVYPSILLVITAVALYGLYSPGKIRLQPLKRLLKEHRYFCLLLVILFLIFALQGTYLEYPSDSISYLSNLKIANSDITLPKSVVFGPNTSEFKFLSSLQDWVIGSGPLLRYKLNVFTAVTKCLIITAIYRVSLSLTENKVLAIASSFLLIGYYGNQETSTLLYQDIDAASILMISYAEGLLLFCYLYSMHLRELLQIRLIPLYACSAYAIWLSLDSHPQFLLYLVTLIIGLSIIRILKFIAISNCVRYGFWCGWRRALHTPILHSSGNRYRSLTFNRSQIRVSDLLIPAGLFLLLALGRVAFSDRAMVAIPADYLFESYASIGSKEIWFYWPNEPNSSVLFLDALAVILSSITLLNVKANSVHFFWSAINLSPYLLLLNPIAVVGLSKLLVIVALHRILYTGQPWLYVPFICQYRSKTFRLRIFPLVGLLCGLTLLPFKPFYGKFYHAFLNPIPSYANGMDLQPLIQHVFQLDVQDQSQTPSPISILGDPYVNSYLSPFKQLNVYSTREFGLAPDLLQPIPYIFSSQISPDEIAKFLAEYQVKYIILNNRSFVYESWVGKHLRHWPPDVIVTIPDRFDDTALKNFIANHPEQFELIQAVNGFELYQVLNAADPSSLSQK